MLTWSSRKPERSNILSLFSLTGLQCMYLAKSFIAQATHLFINLDWKASDQHLPITLHCIKQLVGIHKEAGETIIHSVVDFLYTIVPAYFDYIERHQLLINLALGLPCTLHQLRNFWHTTHIQLLWAFPSFKAIVLLHIRITVLWTIILTIVLDYISSHPVKFIIIAQNADSCCVLVTFNWMRVDFADLADSEDLSSSSMPVHCRQWLW